MNKIFCLLPYTNMFKIVIKGHERKTLVIPSLLESVYNPILPRHATVTVVLYSTLQKAFTHYFDPQITVLNQRLDIVVSILQMRKQWLIKD